MTSPDETTGLSLAQVALNTSDLSASLRLWCELFGFANAGGSAVWGKALAMQGLPEDAHCIVWWLVGARPFFQLEFFHHGSPVQRPQPPGWRPCDHGWVRLGVAVVDFDRVADGLARLSVPVPGATGKAPRRRLVFRDPQVGAMVEVIERGGLAGPEIAYATSSVGDLDAARTYYRDVMGARIGALDELHTPGDEALWGLAGGVREGFVAELPRGGLIEVVSYTSPVPRPRAVDHLTSDQGIMNIAVGSREAGDIRALIARANASGRATPVIVDSGTVVGTYVTESGYEMELIGIPEELDAYLGFLPAAPFVTEFEG